MYDIVVIGAGPAGSTAAKVLAEQGYKGLLAERCKLPRILLRDIDSKIDGFGKAFFGGRNPRFRHLPSCRKPGNDLHG